MKVFRFRRIFFQAKNMQFKRRSLWELCFIHASYYGKNLTFSYGKVPPNVRAGACFCKDYKLSDSSAWH
jgi:hypothetical protein